MLDEKDQKIIAVLMKDGKASVEAVAEQVGLSPTPTRRRIQNLENSGVISGYQARLNTEKLGLELNAYVFIKLQSRNKEAIAEFESRIQRHPEISRCELITGAYDYIMTAHLPSMSDYNRFLRDSLAELPGVFGLETSVVISSVKDSPIGVGG